MIVYLAGPMTGHRFYNVEAFLAAAERWEAAGHKVVSPFSASDVVWQKHHNRYFNPTIDVCEYGDPILREMFTEDIALLLASDAVALLSGWPQSRGARIEVQIACIFGIPIYDAETFKQLDIEVKISAEHFQTEECGPDSTVKSVERRELEDAYRGGIEPGVEGG